MMEGKYLVAEGYPVTGDPTAPSDLLNNLLAEADRIKLSDYPRTIELGEQAYALAVDLADGRAAAHASWLIAWGHNRLRNFQAAVEPARRSLDLAERYDDLETKGYALLCLDAIHAAAGDPAKTLEMCEEIYRIAKTLDHPELMTFALCDLGSCMAEAGEIAQSIRYLEQALAYQLEQGQPPDTLVLFNLGANLYTLGDTSQAWEWLEQACWLSRQSGHIDDELDCRLMLVHMMLETDPHDPRIEEQLGAARQALQSLPRDNRLLIRLNLQQAEVYRQRHQYRDAIQLLTPIAVDDQSEYHLYEVLEALDNLATIYERLGDYPRALGNLRRFKTVEARIHKLDSERRVQLLRTLYEVEQAQHEVEELKRTQAERLLQERADRERELNLSRRQIFSRLSHEFRTPLAIIRSSTDLMTMFWDRMQKDERDERRATVNRQYDILEQLLNDLRALLKMDASPQDTKVLASALTTILTEVRQKASQPERIQLAADSAVPVLLPVTVIQDILGRLLSNALIFSDGAVELSAQVQNTGVLFTVADRGIGIPPAELESVFQPLVRGSNLEVQPGIGVGLSLARHQAQIIGAHLTLESELGVGTRALLSVPFPQEQVAVATPLA
jgi:signal transduction histidine kinase